MPVRRDLGLSLYGAVLLCVQLAYFLSYPIPDFLEKLSALVGLAFLVLACHSIGRLTADRLLKLSSAAMAESPSSFLIAIFHGGVGCGVLGTLVLLLGWLVPGALTFKLSLLSVFLGVLILHTILRYRLPIFSLQHSQFTPGEMLSLVLAFTGVGISFVSCFSPITYYDSLVYHLALPALYNQMGKISAVPFNLYSCFPANTEMLYLYILNQLPQPEYVINLLGWFISLALSLAIAQWAFEMSGKKQAVWAFMLWWTTPAVLLLSVGAYIDVPLAGFIFLAVRSFSLAAKNKWDKNWIVLAGFFAGTAFATKYTGAICPIVLFFMLLNAWAFKREIARQEILIFLVSSLFPGVFWLMKNTSTVGNPFFPFLYNWLGGDVGWTRSTAAGYFNSLIEYGAQSHLVNDLFLAPWRLATSSTTYGGGFDVLGDFGWPLFIFGAPLAFFFNKRHSQIRFLSLYCVAHFLFWFYTKPVLRFLLGALPVFVLLTSAAIYFLTTKTDQRIKMFSLLFISPWLLSNFFMYFLIANGLQPFSVSLGVETKEAYLNRRLAFYPTFAYVNANLKESEKILLIGEQRTYHLKRPFISSNLFASSPIAETCNNAASVDEIARYWNTNKIAYLIINEGEIKRLGGLQQFGFTDAGILNLTHFLSEKTNLLFNNQAVKLYRSIN